MEAVIFALLACFAWGLTGFLGGLKTRQIPLLSVVIVTQCVGLITSAVVLTMHWTNISIDSSMFFAVLAGIASVGILSFGYRGMAIGPMGIVSAICCTGAVYPVVYDLVVNGYIEFFQMLGIILAMLGVTLITREKHSDSDKKHSSKGIKLGILASLSVGAFYIFMDAASNTDPFWATVILRISTCTIFSIAFFTTRTRLQFRPVDLPVLILIGVFDTLAVFLFGIATKTGMVSIVSVISSLYPVVTILLAGLFLRERMGRLQTVGVISALAGVVVISYC
ncbi:MAG: DMT family transporter [Desulfobacterales bacterium]|nr:DMT family transporter [Desulfobacterales bacterium]